MLLLILCLLPNGCSKKEKVHRVGILCALDYISEIPDSFKKEMHKLGYIEGTNIIYDVKNTNYEPEKEKQILNKFVKEKVDLIFTFPTEVSMDAKNIAEGTGVPVLFTFANIEGTHLVENIRCPGGNITGCRYPGPDLAAKRFEILRELVPTAKRIWIPYQKGYPIVTSQLEVLYPLAEAAGITLIECPAANAEEIEADLQARETSGDPGIDSMLIIAEPLGVTAEAFAVFGKFAFEHKIPVGGALISAGGYDSIFGVNVNLQSAAKESALLADKILRGRPAGTLPVVSAESFFQLNYKAAQKIGIHPPEGLLSTADELIH